MGNDIQKFLRFLKDNEAYFSYIKNLRLVNFNDCLNFKNFIDCRCNNLRKNYIVFAFTWGQTKEGHDYWSTLNKKWLSYISSNYVLSVYYEGRLLCEIISDVNEDEAFELACKWIRNYNHTGIDVFSEDFTMTINKNEDNAYYNVYYYKNNTWYTTVEHGE